MKLIKKYETDENGNQTNIVRTVFYEGTSSRVELYPINGFRRTGEKIIWGINYSASGTITPENAEVEVALINEAIKIAKEQNK